MTTEEKSNLIDVVENTLSGKCDYLFAEFQEQLGIEAGDVDPILELTYTECLHEFAHAIADILHFQRDLQDERDAQRKEKSKPIKLIDVLSLISDHTNVSVFDANEDNQLGSYDGRDSVSEVYNNCNVVSIWKNEYEICIDIDA